MCMPQNILIWILVTENKWDDRTVHINNTEIYWKLCLKLDEHIKYIPFIGKNYAAPVEPVIVVHTSLSMQALCTCNNLCTGAKTIIYGVVMNIGVTKQKRLLWICYIYLVVVWSIDGLVHVQVPIILKGLCGDKTYSISPEKLQKVMDY